MGGVKMNVKGVFRAMAMIDTQGNSRTMSACIICSAGLDDVVDLHEAADGLCGKCDGAGGHKEWLHHVLIEDIRDLRL